MKNEQFDILIYGDLVDVDLIYAEHLARKGLNVRVARKVRKDLREIFGTPGTYFNAFDPSTVVTVARPSELITLIKRAKLVLTFTGAIGFALRWRWIFRRILRFPPVVNITTGADVTELLSEASLAGFFYRYFVRSCDYNLTFVSPHSLKNIFKYQIKNVLFLRHPFYLPPSVKSVESKKTGRLRFFHPSHIDFKVNDPASHRNSSKGNDRFLRAFIRALDDELDAECVILDRGSDRHEARAIIKTSKFSDRFIWKPHLSREEMLKEYETADVVVDQFDVGVLGGIAIEAMALAKPVLTYLHEQCLNVVYAEHPPVLTAHTEEDIYQQLMRYSDRNELRQIGIEAKRWVYQNHFWETCCDQFLLYYTLLTGHQVVDYGWTKDPYSEGN